MQADFGGASGYIFPSDRISDFGFRISDFGFRISAGFPSGRHLEIEKQWRVGAR